MIFGMITWNQNKEKKLNMCYMDTDSFIVYIKTRDIYVDIELDRQWPRGKNKKVI